MCCECGGCSLWCGWLMFSLCVGGVVCDVLVSCCKVVVLLLSVWCGVVLLFLAFINIVSVVRYCSMVVSGLYIWVWRRLFVGLGFSRWFGVFISDDVYCLVVLVIHCYLDC